MALQDTYENYIGRVIENERMRRALTMNDVCDGICSISVYCKLESGEYAGGIHVLRALCQRLGINTERCGSYLPQAEYDEMMDRLYILEDIRDGRLDMAGRKIARYRAKYKNIPLNNQFILFMNGRIAELNGGIREAHKFYDEALRITMPEYKGLKKIPCITIYEAYMMLDIAHLNAELGEITAAYNIYLLLLKYCENSSAERWNLVCIYPKTVCDFIACAGLENMSVKELKDMLRHCMLALDMLRETMRLHYIRPLLKNIIKLNDSVKDADYDTHYDIHSYGELAECLEGLFKRYGHERELFEWYPYYVDSGFRCVNQLIDERRRMHNMSIEKLAGSTQSARNVQRIVKGQVSPSYRTSKELLDKLGLKGVLRSDVIVADNIEAYRLWDELQVCINTCDFGLAEIKLHNLESMLDDSAELNHIMLGYMRLWLDMLEQKITIPDVLKKIKELLPFELSSVDKYKNLIKHEKILLYDYIVCIDMAKKYDCLIEFEQVNADLSDELSQKLFAGNYEEACVRWANVYGNMGLFDKSNKIAESGIKIEIECERMRPLSTLLYCIAWNNGEHCNVTETDRVLCNYAYEIAKLNEDKERMKKYKNWLTKR